MHVEDVDDKDRSIDQRKDRDRSRNRGMLLTNRKANRVSEY